MCVLRMFASQTEACAQTFGPKFAVSYVVCFEEFCVRRDFVFKFQMLQLTCTFTYFKIAYVQALANNFDIIIVMF